MSRVGIVGAGIVGSAIATRLIAEGHEVTVFDSDPDGLPTSSGNAALIALPEIAALASPGVLAAVPGWLLDPLGPLTVRWRDLPALTPWLLAFLASATPAHGRHVRAALGGLMSTALEDHFALSRAAGTEGFYRQTGYVSVHDTDASLAAAVDEARRVEAILGLPYDRIDRRAAQALVPALDGAFAGALHQPGYWMVGNPLTLLRALQAFVRHKARLVRAEVLAVETGTDITLRLGDGGVVTTEYVVVAAGVWSRDLVRRLGLRVKLETERGYNTTFAGLQHLLPMPVGFADHGFVATPLVDGLRVGGAVELARPETAPNYARARAMRQKMRRYVSTLPEAGGVEWMGRRPSTPDSLPVIGPHPRDRRVLFAFGHGHLGLTLSATTARIVAGMLAGTAPDPAYSIERFQ